MAKYKIVNEELNENHLTDLIHQTDVCSINGGLFLFFCGVMDYSYSWMLSIVVLG